MRGFGGVVVMFVMGLAALLGGLVPLSERIEWRVGGRDAVMVLEDPSLPPRGLVPGGYDVHFVNVKYLGADGGEVHVPQKRMDLATAQRLVAGARIPVRYMKKNPDRALLDGEQTENPYGWLAVGVLLLATATYGYRLHRRGRPA
jgi:hypothetical protein